MSIGIKQLLCPQMRGTGGVPFSMELKTMDMKLKELREKTWPADVPVTQNAWKIRLCSFSNTHTMCVCIEIILLT